MYHDLKSKLNKCLSYFFYYDCGIKIKKHKMNVENCRK